MSREAPHPELAGAIARLARLRAATPALRYGDYRQLHVGHEQLAFLRSFQGGGSGAGGPARDAAGGPAGGPGDPGDPAAPRSVIVAVNASDDAAQLEIPVRGLLDGFPPAGAAPAGTGPWQDLLNPPYSVSPSGGRLILDVPPRWGRVLAG